MWSNGRVFVRIWVYEVPEVHLDPFIRAYAADGAWAELFGRSQGYIATELYRDRPSGGRFVTQTHVDAAMGVRACPVRDPQQRLDRAVCMQMSAFR
jgi:hypothetical protein